MAAHFSRSLRIKVIKSATACALLAARISINENSGLLFLKAWPESELL
jgi:hypothetical protein